jgi:hypothetical protein
MLPPGRARLASLPDRIADVGDDDRNLARRVFRRDGRRRPVRDDQVDLEPDELGGQRGKPLGPTLAEAKLDRDVSPRAPSGLMQTLHELMFVPGDRHVGEVADSIHLARGLRRSVEGPCRDERERTTAHHDASANGRRRGRAWTGPALHRILGSKERSA